MGSVEQTIKKFEKELLDSQIRKSPVELRALLAAEFMEIASDGRTYNRRQIIEALRVESSDVRWSLSDFRTQRISPDIVLAIYMATKIVSRRAKPVKSLRSSLWIKKGTRWQMLFNQGTPLSIKA